MRIEHIALNVQEPREAARWYAANLGLKITVAREEPPYIHFLVDDGGMMIEFYRNEAGEIPDYSSLSPYALHLAFATADIDSDRQRLQAAGCRGEGQVQTMPNGDRLAFLRDPWGVALQLVTRAAPHV